MNTHTPDRRSSYRALLILVAACFGMPVFSSGQTISTGVPGFISYQGRVLDSTGALVGTGTPVNRTVIFRVWNHPTNTGAANLIYSEEQTVTISEGEFSVLVGQGVATSSNQFLYSETSKGPPASIADAFNGSARYLGVTVDDGTVAVDNEITPRQQVVTSAFAFRSKYAETLGTSTGTALTVLDSGNIGVGTTNPPALFTISGANTNTSTSTPQFVVTADDVSERLRIGVDSTNDGVSFLQSYKEGTGATNLLLQPNGGNVGVGNTNPSALFTISGANTSTSTSNPQLVVTADDVSERLRIGVDSTNDGVSFLQSYKEGTGATSLLLQPNGGNVGIGTTAPAALGLHVSAGNSGIPADSRSTLILEDDTNHYLNMLGPNTKGILFGHPAFGSSDAALFVGADRHFRIRTGGPTDRFVILVDGKVGIGTATPYALVGLGGALANTKLALYEGGVAGSALFGFGIQAGQLRMHLSDSADRFSFLNAPAGTEVMTIKGNGGVGIGTNSPTQGKLVVSGSVISQPHTANYGYLTTTGANGNASSTTHPVSIYATNVIWAGSFIISSSDERIKLVQGRSDGTTDLTTLRGIEITDYRYKDVIANGSHPQKKVIAQQVEKVFPEAVSQKTDTVPDIYRKAGIRKGWIALTTDLKKGERVRLIGEDHDAIHEVTEVTKDGFRTDYRPDLGTDKPASANNAGKNAGGEVFVYGREVNDFRTVDYDALSMLNISATQELARKVEKLEAENAEKDAALATMTKRLAAIENLLRGIDKPAVRTASLKSAE